MVWHALGMHENDWVKMHRLCSEGRQKKTWREAVEKTVTHDNEHNNTTTTVLCPFLWD